MSQRGRIRRPPSQAKGRSPTSQPSRRDASVVHRSTLRQRTAATSEPAFTRARTGCASGMTSSMTADGCASDRHLLAEREGYVAAVLVIARAWVAGPRLLAGIGELAGCR